MEKLFRYIRPLAIGASSANHIIGLEVVKSNMQASGKTPKSEVTGSMARTPRIYIMVAIIYQLKSK
jgi:hypothetical protein